MKVIRESVHKYPFRTTCRFCNTEVEIEDENDLREFTTGEVELKSTDDSLDLKIEPRNHENYFCPKCGSPNFLWFIP